VDSLLGFYADHRLFWQHITSLVTINQPSFTKGQLIMSSKSVTLSHSRLTANDSFDQSMFGVIKPHLPTGIGGQVEKILHDFAIAFSNIPHTRVQARIEVAHEPTDLPMLTQVNYWCYGSNLLNTLLPAVFIGSNTISEYGEDTFRTGHDRMTWVGSSIGVLKLIKNHLSKKPNKDLSARLETLFTEMLADLDAVGDGENVAYFVSSSDVHLTLSLGIPDNDNHHVQIELR